VFSSIQIRYTGRPYLLRQSDSFWHVPKIAFSKGNLGPDLMGLGQNEDEVMIKGRSHGRLFLKLFSNGFLETAFMWLGWLSIRVCLFFAA